MVGSELAVAAVAGGVALALSTTLMAWRFRREALKRETALSGRARVLEAALAEAESAVVAFDGALIAVEGDEARLAFGDEALAACGRALGLDQTDAVTVVRALAETSEDAAAALEALVAEGKPCRFEVAGTTHTVTVEGRAAGAVAWLRATAHARAADAPPGEIGSGPFAALAEKRPEPCWILDADGALVWANRAYLDAVEAETLAAAKAAPAGLDRGADELALESLRGRETVEGFRWITVKGRRRAFQLTAAPVGADLAAVFAVDATDTEETREHLRRHVSAHDETLNHLADAVAIFGPEKRLTYHNAAFEQLWGLDPSWLMERPTHGELLDRLRQKRKLPETVDYPKWKARELEFYGSTAVAPDEQWSLPDGRTLRLVRQPHPMGGVLLLFSDITGELRMKAQYASLVQVQRATLDKLNDAVAVFGSDGALRLSNEAFAGFWRLSPDALDGADFDRFAERALPLLHDQGFWRELKARVTDPDPTARVPVSGEVKTADRRLVHWQSRPLPDGATLVVFDDVTATRELERAVTERERALAEAERLKRDFVGNVSYELRTPLTTIVGYAELLETLADQIPERALNHLSSIRQAAGQLARSIDDVLDMAQIDAGEMGLSLGDVRVCDALTEAAERAAPAARQKGVDFRIDCDEGVGVIRADARRLAQMLDHLLDNAVRSSPAGATVGLAAKRAQAEVRVEVSDTGRGIPYHQQAHVFDRFVGRDRGGPGLGLALVKALADLHGGWIALESEPGKGSTFTLHLPETAALEAAAPELALARG